MNNIDLEKLNDKISKESEFLSLINNNIKKTIIGQNNLIEKLLISILCDGHVFLEGVPGLAKTLAVKTLASLIDTGFQRIQFTPDLLPADILGTLIFNPKNSNFEIKKGPIFSNIILADEINRSPAKVQSALLEAMQERQVTIGDTTYILEQPFFVMATQNPIEQEGTYPLPEAQIDRFMFKVIVDYPNEEEELEILKNQIILGKKLDIKPVVNINNILSARNVLNEIHIAENLQKYIISLINATRDPSKYNINDLGGLINFGASPRASIFLALAAKAKAFIERRGYVIPQDIRDIGKDILRHRIILSYEAEAEEITTDDIISRLYGSIPTP